MTNAEKLARMIEARIGQDKPDVCCLAIHEVREIAAELRKDSGKTAGQVRYSRARGATMAIQRSNVPQDLRDSGDMILAWVNEGDISLAGQEIA